MDWGAFITGSGVIAGPYLAYLGVRKRGKVDETTVTLKTTLESMSAQLDRQDKAIKDQGVQIERLKVGLETEIATNRELRREKAELEGQVRDLREVVEDWIPVGLWLMRGATGKTPTLTWRQEQTMMEYMRTHGLTTDPSQEG